MRAYALIHFLRKPFQRSVFVFIMLFVFSNPCLATSLKPFTIILDWFANPTHGPILIAQEKGYFKQQGLKVNIITPADPTDTAKMVALGEANIGISSDPELLLLVEHGLPLMRIGALIDQPLDAITANTKKGIKNLRDLKGKTIGYPVGGIDKVILSIMLHHVGISLEDVSLVDVHFNLVQALLSKRVDAIVGAMRDYEVPQIELQKMQVSTFYPEDYGMPSYAELNYIINRNSKNKKNISKFLTAIRKATYYIKQHPQKSWDLIIKQYPQLNTPLNKTSWQMTYPLFSNNPTYTNKAKFTRLIQVMHKNHFLSTVYDYKDYVA